MVSFSLDKYTEVELLSHMVYLSSVFWGIDILFSIGAVLVCSPTNGAQWFPFLHILFKRGQEVGCSRFLVFEFLSFWLLDEAHHFCLHRNVVWGVCLPTFLLHGIFLLLFLFFTTSSRNIYPNPIARDGQTK